MILDYVEAMNKAERPVILAGWGVRASGTIAQLREFAERLNVPVLLTWKGIDILPDDHPNYCGRPGSIGQRAANIIQQKADYLLVLGARLDPDQVGFNYHTFAPNARKVCVDIDTHEANKFPLGFAEFHVYDIAEWLKETGDFKAHDGRWLAWCKQLNARYPACLPEHLEGEHANMYKIVDILSDLCTSEDVLALGSSSTAPNVSFQTWRVKDGQRFVNHCAIGAMGFDIPGAIGACVASGKKRTICLTGDGGFLLNIQELEAVRREDLPIKFVVSCNGGYGSIAMMQDRYFGKRVGADPESGFSMPSISDLAIAFGISTGYICRADNARKQLEWMLETDGPFVMEVETPLLQEQTPRVRSELVNGVMVSHPMEDMHPVLAELKAVMDERPD